MPHVCAIKPILFKLQTNLSAARRRLCSVSTCLVIPYYRVTTAQGLSTPTSEGARFNSSRIIQYPSRSDSTRTPCGQNERASRNKQENNRNGEANPNQLVDVSINSGDIGKGDVCPQTRDHPSLFVFVFAIFPKVIISRVISWVEVSGSIMIAKGHHEWKKKNQPKARV